MSEARPPRRWPASRLHPAVLLFLALALPATLILNFNFINFHAPDDPDHFKRAYTLLRAPLRPLTPAAGSSGAMIDSGLIAYEEAQRPAIHVGTRPIDPRASATYRSAPDIRWSGEEAFSEMPGAMSYLPLLYAPQALALELGRAVGATVAQSVLMARIANGLVAIALIAIGLQLLPAGHALALLILLLPRSLIQYASNSADPILYGLALLIVALGLRQAGSMAARRRDGVLTAAALFVAAPVRPPIAALALTPAIEAVRARHWPSLLLLTAAVAGAALWTLLMVSQIVDLRCGIDPGPIGARLLAFATDGPMLIGRSVWERGAYYYASFIGHLGWGDGPGGRLEAPLPLWCYATGAPMLILALYTDARTAGPVLRRQRLSLGLSALGVVLITFLAMYIACTSVLQPVINGVQGRYFVPALLALAPAFAGVAAGPADLPTRLYRIALPLWVCACVTAMALAARGLYGGL